MSREILARLIEDFDPADVTTFFGVKTNDFREVHEALSAYDDHEFGDFQKLGEIDFPQDLAKVAVVAGKVKAGLTERTGKKAQYEKAKSILKASEDLDAGIFIFYDEVGAFRFSLVYGQVDKTKRTWSNFKRFTYFVAKDQSNRTFLKQIGDGDFSSLDKIKAAFSVEAVNKEFYLEIARAFNTLTGGKVKEGAKIVEFPRQMKLPSVSETDKSTYQEFAVRLIGRLVFCWFLKKKQSKDGKGLVPEDVLSSAAVGESDNYYHGVLEPLFFEVLNKRSADRRLEYKSGPLADVPFLNGGLFEAHIKDFYDIDGAMGLSKYINTLTIPNAWFSELFEVFEQYNFTIDENTSADIELSIDPEMLGRIFENLLAEINPETGETARKSTGSYYTPRPIVEYMVDESLKQYLEAKTRISEDRVAALISFDDTAHALTNEEEDAVLAALDAVKIIDPACGSGAFPMGILHKMMLILQKIDPSSRKWLDKVLAKVDNPLIKQKLQNEGVDYIRKLGIIQSSIYGVDIQPIAVELSRLRVFLSLVVDETIDDNKPNRGIEPLPNLEFKFVAANVLIGLPIVKIEENLSLLTETNSVDELKQCRDKYFTSYGADKLAIMHEFKGVQNKMIDETINGLAGGKATADALTVRLSEWDPFADEAAGWFDPDWMFGVRDGFDIVIANPPYVRQEAIKDIKPLLSREFGLFYCGTADLYTYFYKKGTELLKARGHLCFIAPNKFMRAGYGKNTRALLAREFTPRTVIDFCDLPIFDATTYPAVLVIEKTSPGDRGDALAAVFTEEAQLTDIRGALATVGFALPVADLRDEGWTLETPEILALMEKLRRAGTPLGEYVHGRFYRGILTGLNEAFVIDAETRKRLIAEDPKSEELIKPWLRGRDIKKWSAQWAGLYVINIPSSANNSWPWSAENGERKAEAIFSKTYPAIHDHFLLRRDALMKRDDQGKFWWELRSCAYYKEFEGPKIMYPEIATKGKFYIDQEGFYSDTTTYIMAGDSSYLLGFLNSKIFTYMFAKFSSEIRGGFYRWKRQYMEQIPVFPATAEEKAPIIERVDQILAITKTDDYLQNQAKRVKVKECERQIDQLIYELYGLTEAEVAIVEGPQS